MFPHFYGIFFLPPLQYLYLCPLYSADQEFWLRVWILHSWICEYLGRGVQSPSHEWKIKYVVSIPVGWVSVHPRNCTHLMFFSHIQLLWMLFFFSALHSINNDIFTNVIFNFFPSYLGNTSFSLVNDMIESPFETKSDSFYFVNGCLIMHNKASYKVNYLNIDIMCNISPFFFLSYLALL